MTSDVPPSDAAQEAIAPSQRMWLSALFGTLAFAGFGHVMVGRYWRGLAFGLAALAGLLAAWIVILARFPMTWLFAVLSVICLIQLATLVDAVRCGLRPAWQWGHWWSRGLVVLAAAVAASTAYTQAINANRERVFEAFKMPTNGMMPALIGESVVGTCASCKKATRVRVPDEDIDWLPSRGQGTPSDWAVGICSHCGAMLDKSAYFADKMEVHGGDRFFVDKRMSPRRWDIVAFRFPENPQLNYAMRLVGLPGERIEIVNGQLTVNGKVEPPPEHVPHLNYLNLAVMGRPGWGETGNPAQLGADEYFVLGDFSARSADSRLWRQGAAGHPPYAVPRNHILGVATSIYWPPDRWHVFERVEE